jgi:hypothetical protein
VPIGLVLLPEHDRRSADRLTRSGFAVPGWFSEQVVHSGRLPLFCFFVAFVCGFTGIRISVRMIRAGVRWWPGNLVAGAVHVHHMVFGVILMAAGGIAGLAAPPFSLAWRTAAAAVFGLGTALVLDGLSAWSMWPITTTCRVARAPRRR